ncbi:PREDICTED: hyaluronidase-1-like [Nanorana parkeri]|uniref:hyaluronidase-1-like n=1 Tax=Nanorana parkeri TaxID=125878 RepID=UPI000854C725|nr:PREDICTED: hyaluronidase-1-like [Nanorana parkeri]
MPIRLPAFVATSCILLLVSVLYLPAGGDPIVPGWPFIIMWNAPTQPCLASHNVSLDLEAFDIVVNQNHSLLGPEVVIFYSTKLGLYPYYSQEHGAVNGGLPQNVSLEDHLVKAQQDLKAAMVDRSFRGVAVVDWEEWRPLWARNWENMTLYQLMSLKLVHLWHPGWSYRRLKRLAKKQFEAAAKKLMTSTLQMALQLSPNGLWGFYGFPECYNYGYIKSSQKYTGRCSDEEMQRNDALDWLWRISRALYPHIYLDRGLKNSQHVGPFVRYRVQEGLRVAADVPVLPYARIAYTYSMDFLTQDDLMKTIGQSAALGASGIVLWGNNDYSRSKESCLAIKGFTEETLAPYLKNVTAAAVLCSRALCSGNGRCVRRFQDSDVYLHLDPQLFTIRRDPLGKGFAVHENLSGEKPRRFDDVIIGGSSSGGSRSCLRDGFAISELLNILQMFPPDSEPLVCSRHQNLITGAPNLHLILRGGPSST